MKNKLDPFRERIIEWRFGDKRELHEIQAQLAADGCKVVMSQLGKYCQRLEKQQEEEGIIERIIDGSRASAAIKDAYAKNPAPDVEELINVTKTLILEIHMKGDVAPGLLSRANQMQQTVLNYLSGKTKAEIKLRELELDERRVKVLEEKLAAATKTLESEKNTGAISQETFDKIARELKLL